jgi:hypothetical protein
MPRRKPQHRNGARLNNLNPDDGPHESGLPAATGPEQPGNRPRPNLEGELPKHETIPPPHTQPPNHNRVGISHTFNSAPVERDRQPPPPVRPAPGPTAEATDWRRVPAGKPQADREGTNARRLPADAHGPRVAQPQGRGGKPTQQTPADPPQAKEYRATPHTSDERSTQSGHDQRRAGKRLSWQYHPHPAQADHKGLPAIPSTWRSPITVW